MNPARKQLCRQSATDRALDLIILRQCRATTPCHEHLARNHRDLLGEKNTLLMLLPDAMTGGFEARVMKALDREQQYVIGIEQE